MTFPGYQDRISHRGRGLLLLGGVWFLIGVAILSDTTKMDTTYPLAVLPAWAQGALWVSTGTIAFVASLAGAAAPRTKWAFAALLVPASARCLSFAVSWVWSLLGAPLGRGDHDAWVYALSWALVVAFVLHEASTPVIPTSLTKRGGSR